MTDNMIQRFRVALEKDIHIWEAKLEEAMATPLDEYGSGEIFMTQAQAKRASIRDAEFESCRLKRLLHSCFPSEEYVRGIAEDYMWAREGRKIT